MSASSYTRVGSASLNTKNIFEIEGGVLSFGDEAKLNLPSNFKGKSKITINPSKIKISKTGGEGQISGVYTQPRLHGR